MNSINPGVVITEGVQAVQAAGPSDGDLVGDYAKCAALGRTGTPADIAPLAVFLASAESGWLTGETLFATGGVR